MSLTEQLHPTPPTTMHEAFERLRENFPPGVSAVEIERARFLFFAGAYEFMSIDNALCATAELDDEGYGDAISKLTDEVCNGLRTLVDEARNHAQ